MTMQRLLSSVLRSLRALRRPAAIASCLGALLLLASAEGWSLTMERCVSNDNHAYMIITTGSGNIGTMVTSVGFSGGASCSLSAIGPSATVLTAFAAGSGPLLPNRMRTQVISGLTSNTISCAINFDPAAAGGMGALTLPGVPGVVSADADTATEPLVPVTVGDPNFSTDPSAVPPAVDISASRTLMFGTCSGNAMVFPVGGSGTTFSDPNAGEVANQSVTLDDTSGTRVGNTTSQPSRPDGFLLQGNCTNPTTCQAIVFIATQDGASSFGTSAAGFTVDAGLAQTTTEGAQQNQVFNTSTPTAVIPTPTITPPPTSTSPVTPAPSPAFPVVLDSSASIVIVPKVLVDSSHDTLIQLSSLSNSFVNARCFYVDSAGANVEFDIQLLKQQPILWVASQGLLPSNAPTGRVNNLVPPAAAPFAGELLCVQTEISGAPLSGNSLTALATVRDLVTGGVDKYHATGIIGDPNAFLAGNILRLGQGGDYAGCPQTWSLNHFADGAADPMIGLGSTVHTELTIAPCSYDLANQTPQSVSVQLQITNELEQTFSAGTAVTGWLDTPLGDINSSLTRSVIGTDFAQTQIGPAGASGGFVIVAREVHDSGGTTPLTSSAAINAHIQTQGSGEDAITLPPTLPPPPNTAIFTTSTSDVGPFDITTGPDSNLWFTESAANQIGRIAPSGSPVEEFAVPTENAAPTAITSGPDGNLWFTEDGAAQIGRISTDGSLLEEFEISSVASDITSGPDMNLWFIEPDRNSIGRLAPDGSGLTELALPAGTPRLISITSGPDGNLWFTLDGGFQSSDAIGRITPDLATITTFDIPTLASFPTSITLGPDGNLWFVESGANQIGRITPAGVITEFPALESPMSIAPSGDGNLWYTTRPFSSSACALGRISPAGTVAGFFQPCGLAVTGGADGNIWFLNPSPEQIVRFSP